MSNPHEIFTTHEDRWRWDKYIEQCDLIELSDANRQRAKASFAYLRTLFGEGFLRRAENERNPIFLWYFTNAAPPKRLSLIRLVEALRNLERSKNFRSALKDIKRRIRTVGDYERVTEKLSTIAIANEFFEAGFDVEFDPQIGVSNSRGQIQSKKPDLKITDRENGEEIFVEISRMKASDHQELVSRTFRVIWNVLIEGGMHADPEALKNIVQPRYILPYAVIHRGIEDDELKDIVNRISRLIEHVRGTGEFAELIIPDVIEVGIASYDNHHLAKEWAARKGISETNLVKGAPIQSDEIARARTKLQTELKQLPLGKPSVVIIEAVENLFLLVYDIRALAIYLGEEVKKYSQLHSTVFYHTFDAGRGESLSRSIGPHTFVSRPRSDGSTKQSLVVINTNCRAAPQANTLEKLETALSI
jgi:hypothetical protein